MRRNNKQISSFFILFSLLLIGVVYAILQANLQINGTSNIKSNTWDIHFNNIQVNENSVPIGTGDSAVAIDPYNNCKVNFEVTFSTPGDFYEFTIDIVNSGSIDGMIGELNKTLKINNQVVQETPYYLNYLVTYSDGMEIQSNHILESGATETYKVKLEFKTDIDNLPAATTISTSLEPQYLQADSSAVKKLSFFEGASWDQITTMYNSNDRNILQNDMKEGTLREVELDINNDGTPETTAHIRIANLSTPSECSTTGFSQTACGFVIEFADIITNNAMNSTSTNVGGWSASSLKTYLNTSIYNALPATLKSKVIDTEVVSGHGSTEGETNFTSTEKIYLLSTHEVFEDVDGNVRSGIDFRDTAYSSTRQLDYYSYENVTTSNYSKAIKQYNGSNSYWWLRSANSNSNYSFFITQTDGNWNYNGSSNPVGVSPAFRIAE